MQVKGPRIDRMVVRPVRVVRDRLLLCSVVLVVGLAGFLGWHAGRQSVLTLLGEEGGTGSGVPVRLGKILEENRVLREEVDVFRGGTELNREVEKKIRGENQLLQTRITELEEAVGYYRRVVIPDRGGKGLHIERLELVPGERPGQWMFRLVLVRAGETDAFVEGRIDGTLLVTGVAGLREIPLGNLLEPQAREFRTRHVQDINAGLILPAGARPERLDLAVDISSPRRSRIERTWKNPVAPSH